MIFSITELLDEVESGRWIAQYFHAQGFRCPYCKTGVEGARVFRSSKRGVVDYRGKPCECVYNLYTGTAFAGGGLSPRQAVLLVRGVGKGESSATLAAELGGGRSTGPLLRQKVQTNGYGMLAQGALTEGETETDERFPNAGEKRPTPRRPHRPPRRRANKRRGHGTYANERPPVVGPRGRQSGRGRLRVREPTAGGTLRTHVHRYTRSQARCYPDEGHGDGHLQRAHARVCPGRKDWARDGDGAGIREVHINTSEGLWTAVRNFLRPFRGVHKRYLKYYLAICEPQINRKRISPAFIAGLVAAHKTQT
jgi:transposase